MVPIDRDEEFNALLEHMRTDERAQIYAGIIGTLRATVSDEDWKVAMEFARDTRERILELRVR